MIACHFSDTDSLSAVSLSGIQQYRIFNFIEDGLFSGSFCTTVIMITWSKRNSSIVSCIVLFVTIFRTFDAFQNSADAHK